MKITNYSMYVTCGCGKGTKCSVGLYVLPYSATREITTKYVKDRIKTFKEDYNK